MNNMNYSAVEQWEMFRAQKFFVWENMCLDVSTPVKIQQ